MYTKTKPLRRIREAVHDTAFDLYSLGLIDKYRMQQYDTLCMKPIPPFDSSRIRALRAQLNLSQALLAMVLNTSLLTVRQWEVGAKRPSGPSVKLLDLLERKGLEAVL